MSPYLSVCAIYRDEAPYLPEWLEFHRLVGVERFLLYNNLSVDEHEEVLAPYVEEGIVVLHDWPVSPPSQLPAYEDCLKLHARDSRWIAFIDIDEFLFSPTGRPLPEILGEYEAWPGVVVNWAMFGTSSHRRKPPGLVIENYLRRSNDLDRYRQVKSIVDPTRVVGPGRADPHYFVYAQGFAVDEGKRRVDGPETESVSFSRLRINHYVTKSEPEFRRKMDRERADSGDVRGKADRRLARLNVALNEVADETILMYLPDLRQALAALIP